MLEAMLMGGGRRFGAPFLYTYSIENGVVNLVKLDAGLNESWSVSTDFRQRIWYILRVGDSVYCAGSFYDGSNSYGRVEKRNANNGSLEWGYTSSMGSGIYTSLAVLNGVVVASGSYNANVIGLIEYVDRQSGNYIRRRAFSSSYYPSRCVKVGDDFVVAMTGGTPRAIRYSSTNAEVWASNAGQASPLAYDPDLGIIYSGNGTAINPTSGAPLATLSPAYSISSSDNEFLYGRLLSNNPSTLYKVDKNTLSVEWSVDLLYGLNSQNIWPAPDGYVYCLAGDYIFCVSPTGNVVEQKNKSELNITSGTISSMGLDISPYYYGEWV